jgi:NAD(P)H-dependent FMN reductase
MANPKIAVIIGTTRATRFGEKPAKWIYEISAARADMSVEVIDLRDYPMPFFDEPATNAWVASKNEIAQRWQKKSPNSTAIFLSLRNTTAAYRQCSRTRSTMPIRNGTASLQRMWATEAWGQRAPSNS